VFIGPRQQAQKNICGGEGEGMPDVTSQFVERGDLAHLALFLWASGASGLLIWALRELAASNRRFNDFVSEIARLNKLFRGE
jgi:hypothetical protein